MVEKEVLKLLQVQVTFDESLSSEVTTQAKKFVTDYVAKNVGNKGAVSFDSIKMISPRVSGSGDGVSNWIWLLVLGGVLFVGLLLFILWKLRSEKPRVTYPSVVPFEEEEATLSEEPIKKRSPAFDALPMSTPSLQPHALPSGRVGSHGPFPPLPATKDFVDRRVELLEMFLKNADTFRLYYLKLPDAAKLELYAGLRGPAFDSMLETLGLKILPGGESIPQPSEEQMLFYLKNFTEFIQTNVWQSDQFFGFLHQITQEQILAIVKQENPLVGALILKFLKPEQSAAVLHALTSKERMDLLAQFSRVDSVSTDELLEIEKGVRERVARLPRVLLGFSRKEIDFWSNLLSYSENQEEILRDLEHSRPDLYPSLSRYRFKLEDIPSLPQPLIAKVLSEVDNEQLALALLDLPKDVVEYVLNEVNSNRRSLLSSQLTMYNGLPREQTHQAKLSLTTRFREVMA